MSNSSHPGTIVRVVNGLIALTLGAFVLVVYWPTVQLFELSRADLEYQGVWVGGHAKRITGVAAGGVADRAGLRVGDVLEFDPDRDSDWVLAGYRPMPEGFRATLPVRRVDGSRDLVTLTPRRVAYLPTFNDRMSLLATLGASTVMILLGVFMVGMRPGLMTWSLLLGFFSSFPYVPWTVHFLAYEARAGFDPMPVVAGASIGLAAAFVPFALTFPRNSLLGWPWWKRAFGLMFGVAAPTLIAARLYIEPFAQDVVSRRKEETLAVVAAFALFLLAATAILARTYRKSHGDERARLRWALLGMSAAFAGTVIAVVLGVLPSVLSGDVGGSALTPVRWVLTLCTGLLFPLALGVAVLRERVVDIQFAVSRTLVYGAVTTLALIFVAAVHWLLGRIIEQSHLTVGIEGVAAIGLGIVLHRATHGINLLVDRVLFRKHHRAEDRLRRVTAALPFATEGRAIAEALVAEPVRSLELASAALFYRESNDGPLRRVLAHGWDDSHGTSLETNSLLARYLQAEHAPLRLDDPHLMPAQCPAGAALPVLAIPIVHNHALTAVVLYGSHTNSTLPDPDEVELLHQLAKAAAMSHQQVRIAALSREVEVQRIRNDQLEAALRVLGRERGTGETGTPAR